MHLKLTAGVLIASKLQYILLVLKTVVNHWKVKNGELLSIKKHTQSYGGHVPLPFEENPVEDSSDDEDSNSDENQNIQFEEEEEFYDCNCFCYEEDGANVENIENSDDDVEYEIDFLI